MSWRDLGIEPNSMVEVPTTRPFRYNKVALMELHKGMNIITSMGVDTVRCVVYTLFDSVNIARFAGGLTIRDHHPINMPDPDDNIVWTFPKQVPGMQITTEQKYWMCNIIMTRRSVVRVNNIDCMTPGNTIYAINEITNHPEFDTGHIVFHSIDGVLYPIVGPQEEMQFDCDIEQQVEDMEYTGFNKPVIMSN